MERKAILAKMVNFYNSKAYTHDYMLGFIFDGSVYMLEATGNDLMNWVCLDKASRGAGYSVRFRPATMDKMAMIKAGARVVCSADYFNERVDGCKYNKGEVFEALMTEEAGQTWVKDSVPFTDDGDLSAYGKAWQIKFQGATFINERQMFKMMSGEQRPPLTPKK